MSVTAGSSPLPSPWADADVGSPAVAGSASYANGVFTVNGGGADIWGTSDQFNYVSQPLTGDGSIVARVTSQSDTDPWAKAGVMIKQSTTTGSPYALLAVTPGNGVHFEYGYNTDVGGGSYTFPNGWLKLTRYREHHYRLLLGRRQHLDPGRDDHDLVDRPGHDRPVHHLPQRQRAEHGHLRQRERHRR